MSEAVVKFTYSDLLSAPEDGKRYEIFEGELIVSTSPGEKHQRIVINLVGIFLPYVKSQNPGRIYTAPFDVYFDDETVVEPDIIFISKDRNVIIEEKRINGAPDLIVEILSSGTEARDRGFKFRRYEKEGVKEYWIVDPENRTIEIYTLKKSRYELVKKFEGADIVISPLFKGLEFNIKEVWM